MKIHCDNGLIQPAKAENAKVYVVNEAPPVYGSRSVKMQPTASETVV